MGVLPLNVSKISMVLNTMTFSLCLFTSDDDLPKLLSELVYLLYDYIGLQHRQSLLPNHSRSNIKTASRYRGKKQHYGSWIYLLTYKEFNYLYLALSMLPGIPKSF